MSVAAIVLAGGGSTRFGAPKQLARVGNVPMVARAVAAAQGVAALDPVVVVTGAHAELVEAVIPPGRARVVRCERWSEGLAASLRAGILAAGPVDAAVVLLADQPLVSAALVRRVLREGLAVLERGTADAARPVADGIPGHPVLLGWRALARHRELRGDQGLVGLLDPARVHAIPAWSPAAVVDVDEPADLVRAERALGAAA